MNPTDNLEKAKGLFLTGLELVKKNDYTNAAVAYEEALKFCPDRISILSNLSAVYIQSEKFNKLGELSKRIIELHPKSPEGFFYYGVYLDSQQNFFDALINYKEAEHLGLRSADLYVNIGLAYRKLGRRDEAFEHFQNALSIDSLSSVAIAALAEEYLLRKAPEQCIPIVNAALIQNPQDSELHNIKGTLLARTGDYEGSKKFYEQACSLQPTIPVYRLNLATTMLIMGDFENGLPLYESRPQNSQIPIELTSFKKATSKDDFIGKNILIYAEQGLGDTLQFCRYITLIRTMSPSSITFAVQDALFNLLSGSNIGADSIIRLSDTKGRFDVYSSLMSLPYLFKTNTESILSTDRYLTIPSYKINEWSNRLQNYKRPMVGLIWSGGFRIEQPESWDTNQRRNIPLELLEPILLNELSFVSLQKGEPAEGELKAKRISNQRINRILDLSTEIHDFIDTGSIIENLDLVISVDTSTAHLAASLGKEVWLLNRFDSCWRWFIKKDESPWYPTIKIFNQEHLSDWQSVIKQVKAALMEKFKITIA